MIVEVGVFQIDNCNALAAGVDQLAVADVDADMGCEAAILTGILKEDQIAALQLFSGDDDTAAQLIIA